jgi:hypothetical protein
MKEGEAKWRDLLFPPSYLNLGNAPQNTKGAARGLRLLCRFLDSIILLYHTAMLNPDSIARNILALDTER